MTRGGCGLLCAASLFLCACSARVPLESPHAPAVDAQALIRRGCYSCLEAAFAAATDSGAGDTAFETALLLTLRSKELGLPFSPWLERAIAEAEMRRDEAARSADTIRRHLSSNSR